MKSMMCPRERSRVRRKSKVSAKRSDINLSAAENKRTVALCAFPLSPGMLFPEVLDCLYDFVLSLRFVPEVVIIRVSL